MTFHKLLLTTALASVTGFAAQAESHDMEDPQPEPEASATVDVPKADADMPDATTSADHMVDEPEKADVDMPEATMGADDMVTAPKVPWIAPDQQGQVARTTVDRILSVAEDGARLTTVDNEMIGTVVSYERGGEDAYTLTVEVADSANLPAERLRFEANSLKLKQAGEGLQYDYSLEQLREAVAARVSAEEG